MPDSPSLPPEAVEAAITALVHLYHAPAGISMGQQAVYRREAEAALTAALPHLHRQWEATRVRDLCASDGGQIPPTRPLSPPPDGADTVRSAMRTSGGTERWLILR